MPYNVDKMVKQGHTYEDIAKYLANKTYQGGKPYNLEKMLQGYEGKALEARYEEIAQYLASFEPEQAYRDPAQVAAERVPQWGRKYPNIYGSFGALRALYETIGRPTLEGVGLFGGGVAGTPAALPTGGASILGGAGLGYAMARRVDSMVTGWLNELEGIKNRTTVEEEAIESLREFKEGVQMEMIGRIAPGAFFKAQEIEPSLQKYLLSLQPGRNCFGIL